MTFNVPSSCSLAPSHRFCMLGCGRAFFGHGNRRHLRLVCERFFDKPSQIGKPTKARLDVVGVVRWPLRLLGLAPCCFDLLAVVMLVLLRNLKDGPTRLFGSGHMCLAKTRSTDQISDCFDLALPPFRMASQISRTFTRDVLTRIGHDGFIAKRETSSPVHQLLASSCK